MRATESSTAPGPGASAGAAARPPAAREPGAGAAPGAGSPHGSWRPGGPYSLEATLGVLQRGMHDPCVRVAGASAWLAVNTGSGAASLRLELRRDDPQQEPVVDWQAWGPGADDAAATVPALLGAGDDWSGFDDPGFAATLPRPAREARRRNRGIRLPSTGRVFDALVPVVLEQKVTTIEARHAWRYLAGRFGDPAPGPVPEWLRVPPRPAQLRRVPSWDWHAARVDAHRRDTILRAAASAAGLDRLAALSCGQDPGRLLQTVPGIGPWTAAEVLQRTHGHPDAVSVGDFHLAGFVGHALTGRRTDDAGMLRLLEPWAGHRQRVVRMLYLSGIRKPSFGPRLAPLDHRSR
ncbi:DNA-3-methyladenine glycosylase family protein [Zafaria sp. Z1313]|uniref:DNA-3-methyladenine glycosylase family protein n=1 Tax=unclassified Zafaria TaxID=2828765 RepID=UPI003D3023EB